MALDKYFTTDVIEYIKDGIADNNGNEVFFTGKINEDGIIVSCKIGARGNINTVPVQLSDMREACVLIHNHPSGNLTPSDPDLGVAQDCSYNAQGFYIINNTCSDIKVVVEPIKPKKIVKLDEDVAGAYISEGGALSKLSENFEERPVQIQLLKNIASSFNNNNLSVFEAGTGVGKSYSYLIPSILWAINNNERVIVSTGTINLQQQLCEKDIPAVEKILNKKINYVLMKGRQNFICKRRLYDAASVLDGFEEDTAEIKKIADWAENSETGSRSDLAFMPHEGVWTKVNSESDACMGMRCPFHSECFVMKMRKEASSANLLVVNHHLLFADIESRLGGAGYEDAAVLPPYSRIIFDEAHGIESAATSFFSASVNRFRLNKLIGQMYRKRRNSFVGHLYTLSLISENEEKVERATEIVDRIKNSLLDAEINAKDLLIRETTLRLYEKTARNWGPLLVSLNELTNSLMQFVDLIRLLMDGVADDDKDAPCYWESKIVLRRLDAYVLLLKSYSTWDEEKDQVFWIQRKRLPPSMVKEGQDNEFVNFNKTPLDISSTMNDGIFEHMKTVVCTSATLSTGRSFNYWMGRNGLLFADKERVKRASFESPFPYSTNMLVGVPKDAPLPENSEYQQYIEMAIPRLIKAAEGRTLILFTSYESLKSAHRATVATLPGFSGRIMKQGEDDNGRLLEAFKSEKESVLFATDSFWQGVDVPGDSLSQVIIVKLPFTVPNDPIFVARSEAIEKRGGSPFMDLSVPEAIIKFRQGVGRLIRRSDDKGAVVILDRRVFEKRYGSIFMASIPRGKVVYEPLSELTDRINHFIFG